MEKNTFSAIAVACFLCSSAVSGQDLGNTIKNYLISKEKSFEKKHLDRFTIDYQDHSESLAGDIIKIQQTYNGLPVFNAVSTIFIKDGNIKYAADGFERNYEKADDPVPFLSPEKAFEGIAGKLNLKNRSGYMVLPFAQHYSGHKPAAKQRLVYKKHGENLILCYEFLIPENENYWDILLHADTGEFVSVFNLANHCRGMPEDAEKEVMSAVDCGSDEIPGSGKSVLPLLMNADNASYNVFKLPTESPVFDSRNTVVNPWVLSSSPEGWHSDGTTHYTITRGNNIHAVAANPDFTVLTSPDGGTTRNFNFPFSDAASTDANMDAAVANLFYSTNMAHDILYRFGFTESARNFQKNNFGNGGADNDEVNAVVVPFITNNASFVNHPDGTSGELSVQLWSEPSYLYYDAPAAAQNRFVRTRKAPFGNPLNAAGITGNVIPVFGNEGCQPLPVASLSNKIALMKSGNCEDAVKVKNAQNAGAGAAVIYEASATANLSRLSGNDSTVTIPSVKILNSEGEYVKNLIAGNPSSVTITLKNDSALAKEKNMAFDNVVVMHEYVHGLSNRLTGTGYSCLDKNVSAEQMGEGWSDFYAMMFTNRPEYTAATARSLGTYLANETPAGIGVRIAKYSTDFSVNNYTYGNTNGMQSADSSGNMTPNEHSIGFVWATMLWDLHWAYAAKYGYSSDLLADMDSGSSKVIQLVTDALKLQACNPTFIDGRNAILQAEMLKTQGADKCMIWRTFAKRGLGINASAGNKADINDQVQDFSLPAECTLKTDELRGAENGLQVYPNPASTEFYIRFPEYIYGKVSISIYDMSGKLVLSQDKFSLNEEKPVSVEHLAEGYYLVLVEGPGIRETVKIRVKK